MNDDNAEVATIVSSAQFQRLLMIRSRVRFTLALVILLLHAFFVGGIAFYHQWFSQPLYPGSSIPVGIVAAATVIVLMVVFEAVYIWISKKVFDPLQQQVLSRVNDHA